MQRAQIPLGLAVMADTVHSRAVLPSAGDERLGFLLVFLSALCWSFGGAIGRFVEAGDSWTIVFWRSSWAAVFLLGYMIWRDGAQGTARLFRGMGLPGVAVACCFAIASTSFVVALSYTTVANILLMQAGVPLIAALIAFVLFGERVSLPTWIARYHPVHAAGRRLESAIKQLAYDEADPERGRDAVQGTLADFLLERTDGLPGTLPGPLRGFLHPVASTGRRIVVQFPDGFGELRHVRFQIRELLFELLYIFVDVGSHGHASIVK